MKDKYNFPKISMEIILHAGDARNKANEAIDVLLNEEDIGKANKLLVEAKEDIKKAHSAQTKVMQELANDEFEGNDNQTILPMLFIHAQDTIMTIMSEVNMVEKLMLVYKKLSNRSI